MSLPLSTLMLNNAPVPSVPLPSIQQDTGETAAETASIATLTPAMASSLNISGHAEHTIHLGHSGRIRRNSQSSFYTACMHMCFQFCLIFILFRC